jgi:hypothetical protein
MIAFATGKKIYLFFSRYAIYRNKFQHNDLSPEADELRQLIDLLADRSTQDRALALKLVKSVFEWEKE